MIEPLERAIFGLYRAMRRETALEGLSPQDPVLLKQIDRNPGVGVAELAAMERLRAPTITSHIKRMEKAGLIRRVYDAADRRRVGLHLTSKGRKAIELATKVRHAVLAARLADLSPAELRTLEAAVPILQSLVDETPAAGADLGRRA